jgi:diguanylate cyclase (GGDEF)-like protein
VKRSDRHAVAVRGEVADARAELSELQVQIEEARHALDLGASGHLVAVNEHLVCNAMIALREAEESREALAAATHAGQIDALTQLPNRAQLMERLSKAIADARRQDEGLALLFIDIDNFKGVNDEHGHAIGDELLKILSRRLAGAIRPEDTASRHGGDEFLVLLTSIKQPGEAVAIARTLIAALGAECVIETPGSPWPAVRRPGHRAWLRRLLPDRSPQSARRHCSCGCRRPTNSCCSPP